MSCFLTIENLSTYIQQLQTFVLSSFCDHISMKCLDKGSTFQFISCPIRLLEEIDFNHPYHSLILEILFTFHRKYDGCSCKTLLFYLINFYRSIQILNDRKCQNFQIKLLNSIENFIEQSKQIAKSHFIESFIFNLHTFSRICRYQTVYADCLYQAYIYFHSLKQNPSNSDLRDYFSMIHHVTHVKYLEEKCLFIPGTLLTKIECLHGFRRTIFIDGHLLEDYVHIGYNNKIKLKHTSTKSSPWIYMILSILNQYSIEIIVCSGKIDENLKQLNNDKRIFLENISRNIFKLYENKYLLNYITDLTDENILLIDYQTYDDDKSLTIIDKGYTILHYVSCQQIVDVKHEQLSHCLARIRSILNRNYYLNGSGVFERQLYKYFHANKSEFLTNENTIAYQCFLDCLELFEKEIFQHNDTFENDIIDDFDSKFESWKISIELLKILIQIDHVVQIVDDQQISDI